MQKVNYQIHEHEGNHRVRGVKIEGEKDWYSVSQAQWVNNHWEEAGCNWFTKEQMVEILENESKVVESGTAILKELNDSELESKVVLVGLDEFENEYYIS